VWQEFESYLKCGHLEHGFLRVRCDTCHTEQLVAFSCKRRGICPSCGARRMADTAALLVDEVLPEQPLRQWVLSVPQEIKGSGLHNCIKKHLQELIAFMLSCTKLVSSMKSSDSVSKQSN
jgi:ribosomal protein S27E